MRIALATTAGADDEDLPLLAAACRAIRMETATPAWDDHGVDWSGFDMVVVRSTWDYAPRRDEFLAWARKVAAATVLENPPDVLAWDTDKRYLSEIVAMGCAVVPTTFVEPGEQWTWPPGEFVVKPVVAAGSRDAVRYRPHERARAATHLSALARAGRAAMIQPYQAAVDHAGERALVFIDGGFSHACTKQPLLRAGAPPLAPELLYAPEEMSAAQPSPGELALARRVMDRIEARFGRLLYARVDLVDDAAGRPQVLEVELAEPSLFHAYAPASAARLAGAIRRRLARR